MKLTFSASVHFPLPAGVVAAAASDILGEDRMLRTVV